MILNHWEIGPKTIYWMIFQKHIVPDMFSWISHCMAVVCALLSVHIVLNVKVTLKSWKLISIFRGWHDCSVVSVLAVKQSRLGSILHWEEQLKTAVLVHYPKGGDVLYLWACYPSDGVIKLLLHLDFGLWMLQMRYYLLKSVGHYAPICWANPCSRIAA